MGRGKDLKLKFLSLEVIAATNAEGLLQDHADCINVALGRTVEAIFGVGRALLAVKAKLEHGQWERLFAGHPEAVKRPVPFSVNTGKRFMLIAENKVLSDRAHGHALPPSWRTLYELTKVPEPVLAKALDSGLITPTMERKHVAGLPGRVVALDGPRLISTEASTPAARDFDRIRDEILSRREFADRWQALQELEREEKALAKKLARVREQVRQGRQRLAEDLQKTVEAEHGPIRYRSEVLAGKGRGHRATHGAAEMLTVAQTLPFNGALATAPEGGS